MTTQSSTSAKKAGAASSRKRKCASLAPAVVAIADLKTDPRNVRTHGRRNIDVIASSLKRFGQQKPIVVNGANVVVAGSGTLAAARRLGWKTLDVVRTSLSAAEARAFAVADNRSAELADWDNEALAELLREDLLGEGEAGDLGFSEKEIDALLDDGIEGGAGDELAMDDQFKIVITCQSERQQVELLERFAAEGLECKALVG